MSVGHYSALNKKNKQKLNLYQWLKTGVLVPEEIYVPTNSIKKDYLKTKPFIFEYCYIFPIQKINDKTFSLVFTGVQVANMYETQDKEVFVRDWSLVL